MMDNEDSFRRWARALTDVKSIGVSFHRSHIQPQHIHLSIFLKATAWVWVGLGSVSRWIPACPNDYFSWQFFGRIAIATPGQYTFAIESDDGSLLYLNLVPTPIMPDSATSSAAPTGEVTVVGNEVPQSSVAESPRGTYSLIIDNDGLHGARKYSRTIQLQSGTYSAKVCT
jgi:hypothetical protein